MVPSSFKCIIYDFSSLVFVLKPGHSTSSTIMGHPTKWMQPYWSLITLIASAASHSSRSWPCKPYCWLLLRPSRRPLPSNSPDRSKGNSASLLNGMVGSNSLKMRESELFCVLTSTNLSSFHPKTRLGYKTGDILKSEWTTNLSLTSN